MAESREEGPFRLALAAALVAVAVGPLLFVLLFAWLGRAGDARVQRTVAASADEVAAGLRRGEMPLDPLAREGRVRVRILGPEGEELDSVDHRPRGENSLGLPSVSTGPVSLETADEDRSTLRDQAAFARAVEIGRIARCEATLEGELLLCEALVRVDTPRGMRVVAVDRGAVRGLQLLGSRARPLLHLSGFALIVGLGLAFWLGRRLVRPLSSLRHQLAHRTGARPSTEPLPEIGPAEIVEVTRAFNGLLVSLEEQRRANERFVADLAHELKGPLSALRASVELLAQEDLGPSERGRMAAAANASVGRLDTTVTELLELARAEAGRLGGEPELLSLDELVRDVVAVFREERAATAIAFVADTSPVRTQAVAGAIGRVVRSLLDNAADHAERRVEVRVAAEGEAAVIDVRDDGPGFAPEVRDRAFERFVSGREGGTGIGLALVHAVARAHGGTASIDEAPGGGARVTVRLPRTG